MTVRVVAASDARRMPWKNGRGTTLELATDAPAGDPSAWTWRLSIADVPERGPFSRFPGVDRAIACLVGDGLRLLRGRGVEAVPQQGPALDFTGEEEVDGEPLGTSVQDVNLMVRRGVHRGRLRVERGRGDAAEAGIVVIHAFTAPLAVELGRPSLRLETGSTLVAAGSLRWSTGPDAVTVVAEIDPSARS